MKGRSGFLLLDFKLAVENFDERAGPKSFPILSRCKRRSEKSRKVEKERKKKSQANR
jgi:hypothetical protein